MPDSPIPALWGVLGKRKEEFDSYFPYKLLKGAFFGINTDNARV